MFDSGVIRAGEELKETRVLVADSRSYLKDSVITVVYLLPPSDLMAAHYVRTRQHCLFEDSTFWGGNNLRYTDLIVDFCLKYERSS